MEFKKIKSQAMKHSFFTKSKQFLSLSTLGFLLLLITSCGAKSDAKDETSETKTEAKKESDTTSTEAPNHVEITQKQYTAINIQLGSFEKKNLANVLKATGYLSVPPQNKATVTSPLGGTIKTIFVQEGNTVRKGQTLATIVNPEFVKMQQDYLEAQAQLSFAEANYKRQQELAKENVTAQKTFQQATTDYNSLIARVNSLKSQFSLIGMNASSINANNISSSISIRSPISGDIAKININLGLTIDPSTALMTVVDNSHLHLDLFVYEQDLPKVKIGQNVDFTLINLPGKDFTAKIYSIGSAFENETKTIPIHAEIENGKSGLIEGMNVTGLINIGENLTTAIPSNAVVSFSGTDYIFVQRQDSSQTTYRFERIRIKKGITNGGYTEVTPLEDVPDSSKIVTNGAFYLMAILTNAGEEE